MLDVGLLGRVRSAADSQTNKQTNRCEMNFSSRRVGVSHGGGLVAAAASVHTSVVTPVLPVVAERKKHSFGNPRARFCGCGRKERIDLESILLQLAHS